MSAQILWKLPPISEHRLRGPGECRKACIDIYGVDNFESIIPMEDVVIGVRAYLYWIS